mmetsp:Transcript_50580/g.134606  ORF Transcript_50580/g.134606 Transcript_50580/m.134606 type:complete len:270 (+) Transcript_50580:1474-2283(+)
MGRRIASQDFVSRVVAPRKRTDAPVQGHTGIPVEKPLKCEESCLPQRKGPPTAWANTAVAEETHTKAYPQTNPMEGLPSQVAAHLEGPLLQGVMLVEPLPKRPEGRTLEEAMPGWPMPEEPALAAPFEHTNRREKHKGDADTIPLSSEIPHLALGCGSTVQYSGVPWPWWSALPCCTPQHTLGSFALRTGIPETAWMLYTPPEMPPFVPELVVRSTLVSGTPAEHPPACTVLRVSSVELDGPSFSSPAARPPCFLRPAPLAELDSRQYS